MVWTVIVPQAGACDAGVFESLPSESSFFGGVHPQDGPHIDLHVRVDEHRVLLEIGINLVFLDWLGEFPREDLERVDASELPRVAKRLEQIFAERVIVMADGRALAPRVVDIGSNDPDEALLPLFPVSGWRGLRKLKLEVEYATHGSDAAAAISKEISLLWPFYPPDLLSLENPQPSLVIAAEWSAEGLRVPIEFSSASPTYRWRSGESSITARMAPLPPVPTEFDPWIPSWCTLAVLLAVCATIAGALQRRMRTGIAVGGGIVIMLGVMRPTVFPALALGNAGLRLPSTAECSEISSTLLTNVYRSFDADEETTIYDALALSVRGSLLERMYRDVRASLVIEEEEGAMSRVLAVEIDSIKVTPVDASHNEPDEALAFDANIAWKVDGRVTHWGHTHDRTNAYEGRFRIAAASEGWRINACEVLSQRRVDAAGAAPVDPAIDEEL